MGADFLPGRNTTHSSARHYVKASAASKGGGQGQEGAKGAASLPYRAVRHTVALLRVGLGAGAAPTWIEASRRPPMEPGQTCFTPASSCGSGSLRIASVNRERKPGSTAGTMRLRSAAATSPRPGTPGHRRRSYRDLRHDAAREAEGTHMRPAARPGPGDDLGHAIARQIPGRHGDAARERRVVGDRSSRPPSRRRPRG